ncbi:MAG: hypothetical protein OCD01_17625 [Fibrobacterales bacterium]
MSTSKQLLFILFIVSFNTFAQEKFNQVDFSEIERQQVDKSSNNTLQADTTHQKTSSNIHMTEPEMKQSKALHNQHTPENCNENHRTYTPLRHKKRQSIHDLSKEQLQAKVKKFTSLKSTGTKLLIGGIVLDVIGAGLYISGINDMASSNDNYNNNYNGNYEETNNEGADKAVFGALILVGSIHMTILGIILRSVGKNKAIRYQKQLDISFSPNSVSLSYNF